MNKFIGNFLESYQIKISTNDRLSWEKVLDSKTLKSNLYCLSKKKSNKMDDLIDIDMIKGSSFPKNKTKLNLINLISHGILRVVFMPFYLSWWKLHTNRIFSSILLFVYFLQLLNIYVYNVKYPTIYNKNKQLINLAEISMPSIIMLILGLVYSYIASSQTNTAEVEYRSNKNFTSTSNKLRKINSTSEIRKRQQQQQQQKQLDMNENEVKNDQEEEVTPLTNRSLKSSLSFSTPTTQQQQQQQQKKQAGNNKRSKYLYELESNDYVEFDEDDDDEDDDDLNDEDSEISVETQLREVDEKSQHNQSIEKPNSESSIKDKVSCLIWQSNEWKGADLSMLEISHFIITNVEKTSLSLDYFYIGIFFSFILAIFPMYYQNSEKLTQYINGSLRSSSSDLTKSALVNETHQIERSENVSNDFLGEQIVELFYILPSSLSLESFSVSLNDGLKYWNSIRLEFFVVMNMFFSTLVLCIMFFTLLSIAERTLVQRFLHAKFFCYLTSNRRARKNNLPHFRLGRVENIKTWLSVRSYMKRRGPQRSIDAIISSTFLIGVGLCSIVCVRFLQDSEFLSDNLLNWKLVVWCLCIWTFMLRFMTVGFKINKKYRNCMSMVITEQINLYLQIEKKPEKKDELTVVNNVLKLAADLLKEIENPFKISGLGINPWVYNVTKVVILSAASAVLSELFGFKLKLYKIKIS